MVAWFPVLSEIGQKKFSDKILEHKEKRTCFYGKQIYSIYDLFNSKFILQAIYTISIITILFSLSYLYMPA